jgi:pimeloyl-ACP methyl ester carboxylesterase
MMPAAALEHVTSSDGTALGVWRSGTGPGLVLVHGTTADHTRWSRVIPGFSEHFSVHAMDRRGRGASDDSATYSYEQEGRDVAAVVHHAGQPRNLVGHSFGGLCALEAALLVELDRLVLYEPPLPVGVQITSNDTVARLDDLIARNQREDALLVFFREVVRAPEQQVEMLRTQASWPARVAAAHTVVREVRLEHSYHPDFEQFHNIAVPTLLLLGAESPSFLRAATERLHAVLPNSRIHEFAGQQHLAMDAAPDEFVRVVSEFLS